MERCEGRGGIGGCAQDEKGFAPGCWLSRPSLPCLRSRGRVLDAREAEHGGTGRGRGSGGAAALEEELDHNWSRRADEDGVTSGGGFGRGQELRVQWYVEPDHGSAGG